MAAKTPGLWAFEDLRPPEDDPPYESHEDKRRREKRAAKAKRLQKLQRHGTIHDLQENPELIPPYIFFPEITKGEIVVIYFGSDVDGSEVLSQFALAAAEGPSPDFDNQRTKSGRDSTLGLQCRQQCDVQIVAPHSTWHRFVASLRPCLLIAASLRITHRLFWFCPDAIPVGKQDRDSDDFDEPAPRVPPEPQQKADLVLCDLADIDDRQTNDYSQVAEFLKQYSRRNPLDRPTVIFIVNEGAFRRTWRIGVWQGCDRVLRAQPVTEEGSKQAIQLVAERLSSLLDAEHPGRDMAGGGPDRSKAKGDTGRLARVVELHRQKIPAGKIATIVGCDRVTVWRDIAIARKRGLIRDDDDDE